MVGVECKQLSDDKASCFKFHIHTLKNIAIKFDTIQFKYNE